MKRSWDDSSGPTSNFTGNSKDLKSARANDRKTDNKSEPRTSQQQHPTVPSNLFFTPESVQLATESAGILDSAEKQLKYEAAKEIATRLNDFLRRLLQDAIHVAAKNNHLKLTTVDLNMALQYNGIPPYFGGDDTAQRPVYRSHKVIGREIFSRHNLEFISVENENEGSLSYNHDVILGSHWLLLDNVQPKVPENPLQFVSAVHETGSDGQEKLGTTRPHLNGGDVSSSVTTDTAGQLHPITKQVLDLRDKRATSNGDALNASKIQVETATSLAHRMRKHKLKMPSLVTAVVDLELQLYYNDLTEAVVGADELRRTEAYESLRRDPSIQPLLPHLVTFICEGIRMCLLNQTMLELFFLIRVVNQLCENEALQLQDHLYRLLPALFSCCVCKQLCLRPLETNHCKLRSYASKCLAKLCNKYQLLEPQIVRDLAALCGRVLKSFLNPRSHAISSAAANAPPTSLASAYGAFVVLCELGVTVVREVLLPLLPAIYEICRPSGGGGVGGMGGSSSVGVGGGVGGSGGSVAGFHGASSSSVVSSVGGLVLTPMDSQVANALEKEFHDRLAPIIAEMRRGNPPEMETLEQYRREFGPNLGAQLHSNIVLGRSSHRSSVIHAH